MNMTRVLPALFPGAVVFSLPATASAQTVIIVNGGGGGPGWGLGWNAGWGPGWGPPRWSAGWGPGWNAGWGPPRWSGGWGPRWGRCPGMDGPAYCRTNLSS